MSFSKKRLGFRSPPSLFLDDSKENSDCILGKTAHYDPENESVTVFTHKRHPKDILRSLSHELVHHCQNQRGDLSQDKIGMMTKNYAQDNQHMRNMEKEAYLEGNMCFRDWEDSLDNKLQYRITVAERKFLKENKNMSVKINKSTLKNLIKKLVSERLKNQVINEDERSKRINARKPKHVPIPTGMTKKQEAQFDKIYASKYAKYRKGTDGKPAMDHAAAHDKATEMALRAVVSAKQAQRFAQDRTKPKTTLPKGGLDAASDTVAPAAPMQKTVKEEDDAFGASHYCIHHGGVNHNGSIAMAEAIQHVAPDANGFISHYDMKLADGTILENVAAEDIQVTNASLAEKHKRDDHKAYKRDHLEETEELEEADQSQEEFAKNRPPYDKATAADRAGPDGKAPKNESKIQTPEQEEMLYESRFGKRDEEVFSKLTKLWTK